MTSSTSAPGGTPAALSSGPDGPSTDRPRVADGPDSGPPGGAAPRRWRPGALEFLIALLLVLVVFHGLLSELFAVPELQAGATIFVSITVQALPFLALGVVLSGVITAYIPASFWQKALPRRSGLAVPVAGACGAVFVQPQVGVREVGNNGGTQVRAYQGATDLDPGAWPWCAAFVCWCLREWIKDPENTKWLSLQHSTPEQWRPKTAGAFAYLLWQQAHPSTATRHNDTSIA
ncbi:MAG: permease, partial [Actinomycetes bacterium]